MNPLVLSLAYKFVAFALMLAEVNSFCERAGLRTGQTFTRADIREGSHVGPARFPEIGGSILTDEYFFGFGRGHLANFYRRDFKATTEQSIQARNVELSKTSSLVDTNGAYNIATNWLRALGIDVSAVEGKYRRNIIQWRFYPEGADERAVPLPVYQVEWRGNVFRTSARETAVVTVTVLGATKGVVEHHILDDSLFLRPALQISEREHLLSIPDAEFQTFTTTQQSNLIARFAQTNNNLSSGKTLNAREKVQTGTAP
jgi:hypothetical protein